MLSGSPIYFAKKETWLPISVNVVIYNLLVYIFLVKLRAKPQKPNVSNKCLAPEQNKGNRAQIKFIATNNRVGGEYRFYVSNAPAQPNSGGERETRLRHRLYSVTFVYDTTLLYM